MKKGNKRKVPELRFPEFEGEWEETRLSNIFLKVRNGFVGIATPHYVENGILYLQGKNIKNGGIDYKDVIYISEQFHSKLSKSKLEEDDLLMVQSGHIGECAVVKGKAIGANCHALLILSPIRGKVDTNFIKHYFYSYHGKHQIYTIKTGNTVEHILASEIANVKVPTPSYNEQNRIALFISKVDKLIANLKTQKNYFSQLKNSLLQKIFSQEIRFNDENGEDFPEWEMHEIGEIFIEVKDKVGDTNTPTYSITAGLGFISQEEKFGRNISGNQNKNYIKLKPGDFSYNKGNSKSYKYGCAYVNNLSFEIAVPNVFISFRLKDKQMVPVYFEELFKAHYLDRYLKKIISSGARMDGLLNVNKESFFKIKIPVPTIAQQKMIASFLQHLNNAERKMTENARKVNSWKHGLLIKLFPN